MRSSFTPTSVAWIQRQLLTMLIVPSLGLSVLGIAMAEDSLDLESEFNTSFLHGVKAGSTTDLSLLNKNALLPGTYRMDVYGPDGLVGRREVDFFATPQGVVEPCLSYELLQQFGLNFARLEQEGLISKESPPNCFPILEMLPEAAIEVDTQRLRVTLSVPQAYMTRGLRGYIDPALWDSGVPAAYSTYNLSARRNSQQSGKTSNSYNIGFLNGVNLGSWRLRNQSNWNSSSQNSSSFKSNQTYLQRDLTSIKSQLSVGDVFSSSKLFDSVRFRGVQISSDEAMRPDLERGYAPVIRGTASSNATIEVRQDGFVIYQTTVPPGPFEIDDLPSSGSSGDLEITLIEADGSRQVTRQAFSMLPIMLRPGRYEHSTSVGKYRQLGSIGAEKQEPAFLSTTFAYGLTNMITAIGGLEIAQDFRALALGLGFNTRIGAISADLTNSSSTNFGNTVKGNSLRLLYAKTFTGTNTTFSLAGYRYSTEGYRTLQEHVQDKTDQILASDDYDSTDFVSVINRNQGRSRSRTNVNISQRLGRNSEYGSLYFSGSDQRYWNNSGSQSISAGYGSHWGRLGYTLSFSHTRNIFGNVGSADDRSIYRYTGPNKNTVIGLMLSIPLGIDVNAPRLSLNTVSQTGGRYNSQAGVYGRLPSIDTSYSLQAGYNSEGSTTGSINLNKQTSVTDMSLGYSQGNNYSNTSFTASGSVVAHAGGFNLARRASETFILVEVPGQAGVRLGNSSDSVTARNGFAIVPTAMPYRANWVAIDTRNLSADIEFENTTMQVVPRRGAVVLARFQASTGRRVQFQLYDANGEALPVGSIVQDSEGRQLAMSDPSGKALALVLEDAATLTLLWADKQCQAAYALPPPNEEINYERIKLTCQSEETL